MIAAFYGATVAYYATLEKMLAAMTADEAEAYRQRHREMLAQQRLDASEEVRRAREWIVTEGLQGDYAAQLLAFARDLAARRIN